MEASLVSIPHPGFDFPLYLVKLPNFLTIESIPFDRETYDDESLQHDNTSTSIFSEEESTHRVKLKIENTIRWRKRRQDEIESNAHWVRWSDGSCSLFLGKECFDMESRSLGQEHVYVYAHHKKDGLIQCQGKFQERITFRPTSTQSEAHKKLTAAIVEKHQKEKKIKMVVTKKDPEKMKLEMEHLEAERLKAQRRLESLKRSHGEKYRMNLTESYLEEDASDDEAMEESSV
jgi:RNA polymerase-associated protein LEO1